MKTIRLKKVITKNFPFLGFKALTICPWVFIRKSALDRYTDRDDRHETTHALQQIETLWILFFIVYGLEWFVKLFFCRFDSHAAYRSISFEQEAYGHEAETYYNDARKHYAWLGYVFSVKE